MKEEELLKLAAGGRAVRRKRVSRAVLAKMLGERAEEGEEEEGEEGFGEEGTDKERKLIRLLIGSRMLRRRRVRGALIAHLLQERGESEDEGAEDEDEYGEEASDEEGEESGDKERRLIKLLVASRILRRRRVRRALIAHLLPERSESEDEGAEDESDYGEEGEESSDKERRLIKLLVASRILRKRRLRRLLLAHVLRERGEEEGEEGEGDSDKERELFKLLGAGRVMRQRRARSALVAHLLREKQEEPA